MTGRTRLPGQPDRWEDYFEPGERLLWQGAPQAGLKAAPLMIFLSLFGLPFLIVGALSIASGLRQAADLQSASSAGFALFLVLFGVPFVLVGAGLVFGPWYATLKAHEKVRYALSDRRAYIAKSWWNHVLETYAIGPDSPIELKQGRRDTVYFSTTHGRDSEGGPVTQRAAFEHIADGKTVYDLLRHIQKAPK